MKQSFYHPAQLESQLKHTHTQKKKHQSMVADECHRTELFLSPALAEEVISLVVSVCVFVRLSLGSLVP